MSARNDLTTAAEKLCAENDRLHSQLEAYERALGDDAVLQDEIKRLREFIEDVRLGIRDLDEYEAVCDWAYL